MNFYAHAAEDENGKPIRTVRHHIAHSNDLRLAWFAGLRPKPRIHPWNEQELCFPTSRWLDIQADTPVQAATALRELVESKLVHPIAGGPPAGAEPCHLFLFAS